MAESWILMTCYVYCIQLLLNVIFIIISLAFSEVTPCSGTDKHGGLVRYNSKALKYLYLSWFTELPHMVWLQLPSPEPGRSLAHRSVSWRATWSAHAALPLCSRAKAGLYHRLVLLLSPGAGSLDWEAHFCDQLHQSCTVQVNCPIFQCEGLCPAESHEVWA